METKREDWEINFLAINVDKEKFRNKNLGFTLSYLLSITLINSVITAHILFTRHIIASAILK